MNTKLFKPTKQIEYCPLCANPLQIKQGKKGLFLGCSAYPNCDYIKPLHTHSQESNVLKQLDEVCPECNHPLQLRQGSFGMFIACSQYPICHFTVQDNVETETEQFVDCPECQQGKLLARRGRQGKTFYGCSQYPHCKFTIAQRPIAQVCPQCHFSVCILKKHNPMQYQCANKHCRHLFTPDNHEENEPRSDH